MAGYKVLKILGLVACLSSPAYAQSYPTLLQDIEVPVGHKLIEISAEFKTVNRPVNIMADQSVVMAPPVYRDSMVNGVRKREVVTPAQPIQRLIMGPYRTEKVRVIVRPKSYALQDANDRVVKSWRWVKGQLVEV